MGDRPLSEVVAEGDLRASLEALRDLLAASIPEADAEKRAPLAHQLRDVLKDLATMAKPEGSAVDDLAKRRADRRGTKVPDAPGGDVKRGPGSSRTRSKRRTGT